MEGRLRLFPLGETSKNLAVGIPQAGQILYALDVLDRRKTIRKKTPLPCSPKMIVELGR
jgi:hypothetical protein